MSNPTHRRPGFTAVELLTVIAIIAVLLGLLLPAVQQARSAARKIQCGNHLRQLALALHGYHESHRVLPPGSQVRGPSFPTATGWGWGAMILPWLEQTALYESIDFNIGTAVGSNSKVIRKPLEVWRCSADIGPNEISVELPAAGAVRVGYGNYPANDELLSGMSSVSFADVTDGLSNTALLGERGWDSTPDARPLTSAWCGIVSSSDAYVFDSIAYLALLRDRPINFLVGGADCFSSHHNGGAQFALGDGSVRFLNESIDDAAFAALGTAAGGEAEASF